MPETEQSCGTAELMRLLNTKLRKDAVELRALAAAGGDTAARKDEMLAEMFKTLCICFGRPVDQFDFEYTDKDGVYHVDRGLTPCPSMRSTSAWPWRIMSASSTPPPRTSLRPDLHRQIPGQCGEGTVRHLNLPMEQVKALVIDQLKAGEPVWFGSDCGSLAAVTMASGIPIASCTGKCWAAWTWI